METAADVGSTPASESPVANEPAVIEAPEAAAPSLDDDLQGIWAKHNPPRENGRFAPKNPTEQAADAPVNEVAVQTAEKTQEQAKPAIDAPISWTAEKKAEWVSVPPALQEYISQRDKESHEAITRAGQQIKAFEPIRNVIEQHTDTFRRNGLHPADAFDRMMNINTRLEAGPESAAAAIKEIAKAYGVNLQGETAPDATPDNPRIAELEAQLSKISSHLTAQQRERLTAENNALAREIADFANDPKNPHPHFESVRKVMAGLMTSGAAETMQEAYDKAVYADPTIRQSILADQQKANEEKRKADEAERVKAAKKAAGVNVKSSPGQSNVARTLDDDLREIARKHYGTA